jgi:hypothetical protein
MNFTMYNHIYHSNPTLTLKELYDQFHDRKLDSEIVIYDRKLDPINYRPNSLNITYDKTKNSYIIYCTVGIIVSFVLSKDIASITFQENDGKKFIVIILK